MAGSRPINMFTDQRPRMEIPTMQIQIQYEWDGNTYNTNTNTIHMYGMEIPARVISLWPWDQLGLDGGEDNLRSLLDPGRLIYILA